MNQLAIDFLRRYESCRLAAYRDAGGVWTIGYGATGAGIDANTQWSQEKADADLARRVANVETTVSLRTVSVGPTLQQSAALISFAYNVGTWAFSTSHVLAFVLARDWLAAAKALLQWDHVNGVESIGLLKRRMAEGALFLDGSR